MSENFTWRDGDRTIRFGRGAISDAPSLLGEGHLLLTTERGIAAAPVLGEAAGQVLLVGPGRVDDLAADLLPSAGSPEAIVALGGGRVIDVG